MFHGFLKKFFFRNLPESCRDSWRNSSRVILRIFFVCPSRKFSSNLFENSLDISQEISPRTPRFLSKLFHEQLQEIILGFLSENPNVFFRKLLKDLKISMLQTFFHVQSEISPKFFSVISQEISQKIFNGFFQKVFRRFFN